MKDKKKVNILKLSSEVSKELRRQSLSQFKKIDAVDGICFYCKEEVEVGQVREKLKDCYVCPHCGIDSVVPKSFELTITPSMIDLMNLFGFQVSTSAKGVKRFHFEPTLEDDE